MATKTISIDLEAYRRLKEVQKPQESFSQTIKRVVRPPFDVNTWLRKIQKNPLSGEAMEAVEAKVHNRRRSSHRVR